MVCPACQAENRDGARFCNECGTALDLRCASCGSPHRPEQKFCDECGTALEAARPVSGPRPVAAAEMRLVSVLFVDMVGYTSLSESRDAADVRELLGRYFETARTIVERYGGTIEKFIGDAVMAVWGAPVAREDDAERAVRAGLEMVDAVAHFGEDVGVPELRARAGVVTGQVAARDDPAEALVVGDRVNTAARVQGVAEPGTVYVDETTRQVTSSAIAYEDGGEHIVKGKADPLRLWRATRVVAGVAGKQREQGLEAPFVGRDSELRLVKELFHAGADRGAVRLVAVSGPAGVGKTRLRWEFEKYVDGLAGSVLWHTGRCPSYGEGVAYWALAEMVRQRLGIPEDAPVDDARTKLGAGLERWLTDPDERAFVAPRLGALIGVAEPGVGREELFAGWRLFIERLADHLPVTMVFEDLQWADAGVLDFIEHLLDWSTNKPIFILTLARPDLAERREGWPAGRPGAAQLYLEPLGLEAMEALLDGLVGGLPDEARLRIAERAEGIPLYAIETVRALADRGALTQRQGRWTLEGDLGELDVPASLSSLLAARLDVLDAEERELVKSMALFGGSFPRSAAASLGSVSDERLDGLLASLVRKQVFVVRADPLSPDRGQYAFAQTLLRTVAYDMLSKRERKARHVAAAEHLRQAFPDDGEDVAEVIAHHYLDAYHAAQGDPDEEEHRGRALTALRRAAQRALIVGAPDTAKHAFRTAAELADDERERIQLTAAAADAAMRAGEWASAVELFDAASQAHRSAGREDDAARLGRAHGEALRRLGRVEDDIALVREALALLGDDAIDADVAALNGELGAALTFHGEYDAAAPALERALQVAEALGLPEVICNALGRKSLLSAWHGRAVEARVLFNGGIALAEENGLTDELQSLCNNAGDLCMHTDMPGAAEYLEKALTITRRLGNRATESLTAGNLMLLDLFEGRWEQVEQRATPLLADERPDAEHLHERLGVLHAARGDLEAARRSLEALGSWKDSDNLELSRAYALLAAVIAVGEGDASRAFELAGGVLRAAITVGSADENVRSAWPIALDAALAAGRLDDAAEFVALLEVKPPGLVPRHMRAQLARSRGLLAAARGDHDAVEADLLAAVDGFRALGHTYWLARAQTDLAAWLIERGRAAEADPLLDEAIATLEGLRAAPALAQARALRAADQVTA